MQLALIEYLKTGMAWPKAALEAGYAESSARNIKALVSRSQPFLDRLQKECRNEYLLVAPKVITARSKALDGAFNPDGTINTERYDKLEKTLDAIERHSGIAKQDIIINKPNFISIAVTAQGLMSSFPEQVQDAEVME